MCKNKREWGLMRGVVIVIMVLVPVVLGGLWVARDTDYGTRHPVTLGELTKTSTRIVVGVVDSLEGKFTGYDPDSPTFRLIETYVYITVWDELLGHPDSLITIRNFGGTVGDTTVGSGMDATFSQGETLVVFLGDYWPPSGFTVVDTPAPDVFSVNSWELGKFSVVRDSVRFCQFGARQLGLPLNLAKRIITSAVVYPTTVDAEIDTLYEEAKAMIHAKVNPASIKQFVYDELEKIATLAE